MRKVSREVATAFLAGKTKNNSNTSTFDGKMYLYGNLIATNINGAIKLYDGGFATATTKDRLNAILQLMRENKYEMIVDYVFQKDFQWFFQFNNKDKCKFVNGIIVGVK